jgi:predicted GTPase
VSALTEQLMMDALGRNVQYYDAPAVRAVVRAAADRNYEFSAIVEGIVASVPFQMRAGRATAPTEENER